MSSYLFHLSLHLCSPQQIVFLLGNLFIAQCSLPTMWCKAPAGSWIMLFRKRRKMPSANNVVQTSRLATISHCALIFFSLKFIKMTYFTVLQQNAIVNEIQGTVFLFVICVHRLNSVIVGWKGLRHTSYLLPLLHLETNWLGGEFSNFSTWQIWRNLEFLNM